MSEIVIADDGVEFDGLTPSEKNVGGAESAVIQTAEALAARGHRVTVYARTRGNFTHNNVHWARLDSGLPDTADLYIANRSNHLIGAVPRAHKRVFWLHNPAPYLVKPRYLVPLWRWRPELVFLGDYHASTYNHPFLPRLNKHVIPYGIDPLFAGALRETAPAPVAVFAVNPLRGLTRMLTIWREFIHPAMPHAQLHLFTGANFYATVSDKFRASATQMMNEARAMADQGVMIRGVQPRAVLAATYTTARVSLYPGINEMPETFCLNIAEAQLAGLPAVVTRVGSLPERLLDGASGFVADNNAEFAQKTIELLENDTLWLAQHRAARGFAAGFTWDTTAVGFEQFLV